MSALDWDRLAEIEQAGGGRGGAAPVLRRDDARPRAADPVRRRSTASACPTPRPGGPPIDWIARALTGGDPAAAATAPETALERGGARFSCRLNAPATVGAVLPRARARPAASARARPARRCPTRPASSTSRSARPRPAPQRLSYSSLGAYARCGYRFYLERVLRLPRVTPPPRAAEAGERRRRSTRACAARSSTGCSRSSTSRGRRARARRDPRARRHVGDRARRAESRGHPRARRRLRRLAAVRAAGRRAPPPARGAVRVRARARRRRPARQRLPRRRRARGRRRRPDRRLQVRPARRRRAADVVERDYATQRVVYALAALRDGAPRVEVAYCFLERPAEPVTRSFTARRRAGARRAARRTRPRCARGARTRSPRRRTASCAATARAAARCARGPRR